MNMVLAVLSAAIATLFCMNAVVGAQAYFDQISDAPEYIVSAKLMTSGKAAEVYNLDTMRAARHQYFPRLRERGLGVFSPPPALLLLLPFSLLPTSPIAAWIWLGVQLALVAGSCLLLQKTWPMDKQYWPWFWSWLIMFGPTYECLRIGQITPLLTFALCVFVYALKKNADAIGGLALSGFILKPQEALTMGIFIAARRRWKVVAGAIAAVVVLCIASFALTGSQSYSAFATMLSHMQEQAQWMQPEITPTIRGELLRMLGHDSHIAGIMALLCLVAALGLSAWRGWVAQNIDLVDATLITMLPLGLLTAMLCHTYDLMLLIPSVYCLANSPLLRSTGKHALLAKILLAIASLPFWLPLYAEVNYGWLRDSALNPFFWALLLFVGTAMWLSWRGIRD